MSATYRRGVPENYDVIRVRPPQKPSWQRRLLGASKRIGLIAVAIFILGYVGVSVTMGATIGSAPRNVPQVQAQIGPNHKDVSFRSTSDNVELRGWLFHAAHPSGRSAILVSGWRETRVNPVAVPLAHDLLLHGYDVLLFDTRGTGSSDGSRPTLGNLERNDVLGAYNFMKATYRPQSMVVFGVGTGGAAVLMDASQLAAVGAIVTDSAFSDLRPVIDAEWSSVSHLPVPLDWPGMEIAAYLGVNPDLSPRTAIAATPKRAYLFFHAASDMLIPLGQAQALRAASSNSASKLVVIAAGRGDMDTITAPGAQAAYLAAFYSFVNSQITAHGG